MKCTINLDEYQQKAVDWITTGTGNLVLQARAGSGKTTTIIESIAKIPESRNVLYLAFNKSIADSAREKLKGHNNVVVRTYHSQGYNILSRYYGIKPVINQYKYNKYLTDNFEELSGGLYHTLTSYQKGRYKHNILTLLDFSRYNLAQSPKEIRKVAEKYCINLLYDEIDVVIKLMEWGQDVIEEIDFPDMLWIPCEKGIEFLYEKYDFVFVDEVQDSSPCQQKLFLKCKKSNARCMMVGDEYQCINEWCGSDSYAFEHLLAMDNTKEMVLPVSYRCSQNIINGVHDIVKDIKPREGAVPGTYGKYIHIEDLKNGDGVLCRNNEPLIRLYIKLLKGGKTAYILGKSDGKTLKNMLRIAIDSVPEEKRNCETIILRLYYNLFLEIQGYSDKNGIPFEDALFENRFKNLIDNVKAAESLVENIDDENELFRIIDSAFIDESSEEMKKINDNECITLSTIHKSKGLEFNRVYEACPSMCPSKLAKTEDEIRAERNLYYVCVTRSIFEFGYIYESDLKPSLSWDMSGNEKEELEKIKEKAESVYGKIKPEEAERMYNLVGTLNKASRKDEPVPEIRRRGPKFKKYL